MRLLRNQQGQALIIAMVLLLLGALVITPMLAYMWSGLKVGKEVYEKRMDELYAADAGVEDGLWHLLDIERLKDLVEDRTGDTLPDDWMPEDYNNWPLPFYPLDGKINGKDVGVIIDYFPADKTFKITSTALSGDGSSTTIVCYASGLDFTNLLNNVITSTTAVTGKLEGVQPPEKIVDDYPKEDWPPAEKLAAWYWEDVKNGILYPNDYIDVKETSVIGSTYTNGDLNIKKTGNSGNTLLTLNGTLYVKGTLETDQTKEFTIDLNKQTIFVEGGINIGGWKTIIRGSGCLIAVGDIKFQPTVNSGPTDFLFVMSINRTTTAQPNGDFWGSFAGNLEVQVQPGNEIIWSDWRDKGLNFPGSNPTKFIPQIKSWNIKTNMP